MANQYPYVKPGIFELYYGPMKSGKTKALIDRVDKLNFMPGCDYVFIKPTRDTRDPCIKSRTGTNYCCIFVDTASPFDILDKAAEISRTDKPDLRLVAIDEIQLFASGIEDVIEEMCASGLNVIAGGINLDFRGLPFGRMPYLLSIADEPYPLTAICEHKGCSAVATRSQRLIGGKPARFDEPIISIEGSKLDETYEARCRKHHIVPGMPTRRFSQYLI